MKEKLQIFLIAKTQQTHLQFIRYIGVGGVAAVVNIGLLVILGEMLALNYLLANVFGFIGGLTANYLLSRIFVFTQEGVQDRTFEFTFYALIGVLGLLLDTVLLWVGTGLLTFYFGEEPFLGIKAYLYAKIFSTACVFVWNFGARKALYASRRLNAFRLPAFSGGLWFLFPVLILIHFASKDLLAWKNDYWPTSSIIKFVNSWLDEGVLNSRFGLYEIPASIEYANFAEREAYMSYPPGSTILAWLYAKVTGIAEMTFDDSRQYSLSLLLGEFLLAGAIFYFILLHFFKVRRQHWLVATSTALASCWMFLPSCIFQLRNACFADCVVTLFVFAFILLEITRDYFSERYPLLKYPWLFLLFFVGLCGAFVDYYIFFVLFVAWLTRVVPLLREGFSRENFGNFLRVSAPYVGAVVVSLALFVLWVILVPGGGFQSVLERMKLRIAPKQHGKVMLFYVGWQFLLCHTVLGFIVLVFPFFPICFCLWKKWRSGLRLDENIGAFLRFIPLIYVAPILQVIALQEHSGTHEVSVLKFAFPIVLSILLTNVFLSDFLVKKFRCFETWGRIPVMCVGTIVGSFSCVLLINGLSVWNGYYERRDVQLSNYELAGLIKQHYRFEDVYFSHTYSIPFNPPMQLALSKKLVYKVKNLGEIKQHFPALKKEARVLLVVEKDDSKKSPEVLQAENISLKEASECFSSENYVVYHYTGKR
ncbi:MAG: GtrA family protein [Puniceicoccales bacterium]|jgi:putative flippase GtrA|nr:GtrA family protein [Puniceicoccales bacterium]